MNQPNPYAPPVVDVAPSPSDRDGPRRFELATPGRRLGGAIIDGILTIVVLFTVRAAAGDFPLIPHGHVVQSRAHFAGLLVGYAIQAALIARSGQSLGKILLRMRIVDSRGRTVDFYRGFAARTLPFAAMAIVPALAAWILQVDVSQLVWLSRITNGLSLLDACYIFKGKEENRTLHDRLAGTYVCLVRAEPTGGETRT